jgi:hypothetical protein
LTLDFAKRKLIISTTHPSHNTFLRSQISHHTLFQPHSFMSE